MTQPAASSAERKQLLLQRRVTLQGEIAATLRRIDRDRYAALADQVHNAGDRAAVQALIDTGHADVQRDAGEIQDIDAALERLELGTYGTCVACGTAIPEQRLAVYPVAKRCLPCQSRHEQSRQTSQA